MPPAPFLMSLLSHCVHSVNSVTNSATVIDGSYPAVSFPKFLYYNALLPNLQVFFGKFLHQTASLCYAIQSEAAMQSNLRMTNF